MRRHLSLLSLALALPLLSIACNDKDEDDEDSVSDDNDGDGFTGADDCDDSSSAAYPGAAELCDSIDNDCDGETDEGDASDALAWYADEDGDGYGDERGSGTTACNQPSGYVSNAQDCDDDEAEVNPGAEEVCDKFDNDCDGAIDEGAESTWYADEDGDGYGDPDTETETCDPSGSYVANGDDCDDTDYGVYPGADEACDDVDNDCDGSVDEDPSEGDFYYPDDDGDGLGQAGETEFTCDGVDNDWDCDDTDATEPQVVDTTASGTSTGSLDRPWTSIQDGIDHASTCVIVLEGTYEEAIDFSGNNIAVIGVQGMQNTIIDASSAEAPGVSFHSGESSRARLQAFTVTGGGGHVESTSQDGGCGSGESCIEYYNTFCGGGLFVENSDPTITDVNFLQNSLPEASVVADGDDTHTTYSFGGGACFIGSSATLKLVHFNGNFADQGGGIYVDDTSAIEYSMGAMVGNRATDGGAVQIDGGNLTLENVLSVWNQTSTTGGGVAVLGGGLSATNVTWGEDDSTDGAAIYVAESGTASVMNSILYGADTGACVEVASGSFSGTYNDVFGCTGGGYSGTTDATGTSGNISQNPRFTDVTADGNPGNDDWSLVSGSPAEDAGNPGAAYDDDDGSPNDMGAYGGPYGSW